MLLGVMGLVGVAVVQSLAADVLLAAEEQRNGRAPTFSATLAVDPATAARDGNALAARLAELAPAAAEGVTVERETTAFVTTATAPVNDVGIGVPVTWSTGGVDDVRRVGTVEGLATTDRLTGISINRALAERLMLSPGDRIFTRSTPAAPPLHATVVAIVSDGREDPAAYGTLNMLELLGDAGGSTSLTVRAHAPSSTAESVTRWVNDAAFDTHVAVDGPAQRTDTTRQVRGQLSQIESLFGVAGFALLIVAAIGLLNVGLATVDQRARELAVRRAVGARRRDVVALVLGSAIALAAPVVAASAVIAAIASHVVVTTLAPHAGLAVPSFPWSVVAVAAASALLTSLAGAAIPALRAARIPIAETLRR